jgi:hypothetical protein
LWLDLGDGPAQYGYKDIAVLRKKLDSFWDNAFELMDNIDQYGPPNLAFNMAHQKYNPDGDDEIAVLSYDDEESSWPMWATYHPIVIMEEAFTFGDAVIQGAGLELGRSILKELWNAAYDICGWLTMKKRERDAKKAEDKKMEIKESALVPVKEKKDKPKTKVSPCVFVALGRECKKGEKCAYRHDLSKEDALRIVKATPCTNLDCKKGPKSWCIFAHPKQKEEKKEMKADTNATLARKEESMGQKKRFEARSTLHDAVGMVFVDGVYHSGCNCIEDQIVFQWHQVDTLEPDAEVMMRFGEDQKIVLTNEQKEVVNDEKKSHPSIKFIGEGKYSRLYQIPKGNLKIPSLQWLKGDVKLNEDIHLISWRNTTFLKPSVPSGQITGVLEGMKEFTHNIPTSYGDCGYAIVVDGTRRVAGIHEAGLENRSTGGQAATFHLFQ